jgi:MoxR-like ATPase
MNLKGDKEAIDFLNQKHDELLAEIGKAIYGQSEVIKQVMISIFSQGHCLLVGVPGLAKTYWLTPLPKCWGLNTAAYSLPPT